MTQSFSEAELEAYLDEELAPSAMAAIESELRRNRKLSETLALINARRDAGVHSIGEIWRRHRVSCPTREQLGSSLLGALEPEYMEYIRFHVELVGCRMCNANLDDLQLRQTKIETVVRRDKYFQSTVGRLHGKT